MPGDQLLCHCVIIQNMHTLRLHYWPLHYCYAYATVEAEAPEFLSFAARTEVRSCLFSAHHSTGRRSVTRGRQGQGYHLHDDIVLAAESGREDGPSRRALNTAQINLHSGHCYSGV